jgi:hypothetical protein
VRDSPNQVKIRDIQRIQFPSPCGVRRVRDIYERNFLARRSPPPVSVPLRGKEGAGPQESVNKNARYGLFPSPCGVRRVRDRIVGGQIIHALMFPSPWGVRRVRDVIYERS